MNRFSQYFSSGPLYYKYAVLAVMLDFLITGILGILFGMALGISGGTTLLQQPYTPLELELLFVVLGSTGTFLATFWFLKRVSKNHFHNVSLFLLFSILASLPILFFFPEWWNSSSNLGINVFGTLVWILIPYITWGIVGKS